ncbi:MAG: glycosyltransferase family 39 protein [Flavobacteriales bacterium]|nr:glycosyltransferase family 39 protein [Flavobacteriales bacterium]
MKVLPTKFIFIILKPTFNRVLEKKEKQFQLLGAICLLLASFFSLGYHHFDEHFQILEFANLKLGHITTDQLPWEFGAKMRPTIQAFMVYTLHLFGKTIGFVNPFYHSLFLRILSAALSFYALKLFYDTFKNHFKKEHSSKWFLILSFSLWFVIYNGVRFSSENWSTLFFMIPFALYFKWKSKGIVQYLFLGLCFGLSFEFRFQAAFMIIGFLAWLLFIHKEKISKVLLICLGGVTALALGAISDHWFYGEWTFSPWNYFYENILAGKASNFGEMPWYWYFGRFFIQGIPPLSLVIILAILLFCIRQRKSSITWVIVPFLLAHFATSHKELRFLFPIVLFILFILMKAFEIGEELKEKLIQHRAVRLLFQLSIVANFIFLAVVCFRPADPQISLYETIHSDYEQPTILYHFDKNPYHRILGINYYKRANLTLQQIQSIEEIPSKTSKKQLLVFGGKKRPTEEFKATHRLIYSSFPEWVKAVNFNNWQERTKVWNVYEIN